MDEWCTLYIHFGNSMTDKCQHMTMSMKQISIKAYWEKAYKTLINQNYTPTTNWSTIQIGELKTIIRSVKYYSNIMCNNQAGMQRTFFTTPLKFQSYNFFMLTVIYFNQSCFLLSSIHHIHVCLHKSTTSSWILTSFLQLIIKSYCPFQ